PVLAKHDIYTLSIHVALPISAGCHMVSNVRHPVLNNRVLRRCLEYARTQDLTVGFCPEDHALAADGCVNEGFIGTRLGLNGIPRSEEHTSELQSRENLVCRIL